MHLSMRELAKPPCIISAKARSLVSMGRGVMAWYVQRLAVDMQEAVRGALLWLHREPTFLSLKFSLVILGFEIYLD